MLEQFQFSTGCIVPPLLSPQGLSLQELYLSEGCKIWLYSTKANLCAHLHACIITSLTWGTQLSSSVWEAAKHNGELSELLLWADLMIHTSVSRVKPSEHLWKILNFSVTWIHTIFNTCLLTRCLTHLRSHVPCFLNTNTTNIKLTKMVVTTIVLFSTDEVSLEGSWSNAGTYLSYSFQ